MMKSKVIHPSCSFLLWELIQPGGGKYDI